MEKLHVHIHVWGIGTTQHLKSFHLLLVKTSHSWQQHPWHSHWHPGHSWRQGSWILVVTVLVGVHHAEWRVIGRLLRCWHHVGIVLYHDVRGRLCVSGLKILIDLDLFAGAMTNNFNGILVIGAASLSQDDNLIFKLFFLESPCECEDIPVKIWVFDLIFMLLRMNVLNNLWVTSIYSW